MSLYHPDFIRTLEAAENDFLQALLSTFSLTRTKSGVNLEVRIGPSTPTIWRREAKAYVRKAIRQFRTRSVQHQKAFDDFLLRGNGKRYVFDDKTFPMRYASGGTLPVVRMGSEDYYCLIYREIAPVGWNIANGGCDSSHELAHPFEAIERELREELIIVEPEQRHRYVFRADESRPIDHPDFAIAWKKWSARFSALGFGTIEQWAQLPLKWLPGPDSVTTHYEGRASTTSEGCFLNVNAEDFGIEVDRVAKISIDESAIICDGELLKGRLVNQLVGMFKVRQFNEVLLAGATHFVPDFFFYNGVRFDGRLLAKKVAACLTALEPVTNKDDRRAYATARFKYDLCPVTRRIVTRYLSSESRRAQPTSKHRTFISFAAEDRRLAARVYEHLLRTTRRQPFFSDETISHPEFGRAIDDALDSATCLVAVGTRISHLLKSWPEYEWRSFHQDILSKRKRNAQILSFIEGIDPTELPRPLRYREAVIHHPRSPDRSLNRLSQLMP